MTNFSDFGLDRQIIASLTQAGYEKPTPIQAIAIPMILEGRDLMGLAQTGTGKTAAFGLPIIQHLLNAGGKPAPKTARALILAPTRELVNQIATSLKGFMRKTPLKINMVVGGMSINRQQFALERGTDILVATPGRLLDLINRKALTLSEVTHLVLDEADQMLDLGFIHDLRKIAKLIPTQRQTLLFSATMPKMIGDLAREYLNNPEKVEVTPPGKAADKIEQFVHFVGGKNDKTSILRDQLTANPEGRAIVFLRTKHGAEKLAKHLEQIGFAVASIHGNKSQGQRDRALKSFREGDVKVLVATDVAARGIDIPGVSHVYNFDLPEVPDAYVHRIGRTARAGREGIAVAFCAPEEAKQLRDIERLMGISITVASGEPHFGVSNGARPSRGRGGRPDRKPSGDGARPARSAQSHRKGGDRRPAAEAGAEGGAGGKPARSNRPKFGAGRDNASRDNAGRRPGHRKGNSPKRAGGHDHAPRQDQA